MKMQQVYCSPSPLPWLHKQEETGKSQPHEKLQTTSAEHSAQYEHEVELRLA
jgi:hypothetical protein